MAKDGLIWSNEVQGGANKNDVISHAATIHPVRSTTVMNYSSDVPDIIRYVWRTQSAYATSQIDIAKSHDDVVDGHQAWWYTT